jgi:signal transduction histidine kinase
LERAAALPRWGRIGLCLALTLAVATGDALTGPQVSFTLLYLLPISLAAWSLGRRTSAAVAVLCAAGYLGADVISRESFLGPPISLTARLWNVGIELGVFLCVSNVLASLRERFESERSARRDAERALADLGLAQRHLLESEKLGAIGRLVAGIAHELNTPLTYVLGNLELLEALPFEERERDVLARLRRGAERLAGLVKKLLVFSRPHQEEMVRLNPNDLVERSLELCRYNLAAVRVERDLAPLPEILGIPTLLETALINLIVNGVQAMGGEGQLTLSSRHEEGFVVLRVSDTGVGIADDLRKVIFEPFVTTKALGHGTGLGLWTVRTVVERHMGQVDFTSVERQGTTFRIQLPPAAPPA